MKKILITGANSYIGTSFENWIKQYGNMYIVDTIDVRNNNWREKIFAGYDSILHVAGIAHIKETPENSQLYYKVNRDLAVDIAIKAKKDGVKQFILMSSMSVYGLDYSNKLISLDTPLKPKTNYGKSKLEAEKKILSLNDENFKVIILRPPMVYGDNSPGNLTKLFKLVRKLHIFPTIKNERSSITVENLCEEIESLIRFNQKGIFLPQNNKYMCTYQIVKEQMIKENVKVLYIPIFNPIIRMLIGKVGIITKCFGDLKYEK